MSTFYLFFENVTHVYSASWSCPPPLFSISSRMSHLMSLPTPWPEFIIYLFLLFLIHWVQLVLAICSQAWGHSLCHREPVTVFLLISHQPLTAPQLEVGPWDLLSHSVLEIFNWLDPVKAVFGHHPCCVFINSLVMPQDRVSQHSPHLLALLFFLYHLWRSSLSRTGKDRGPIYGWALHHLRSALGIVMHLCKDNYPLQKEVSLPRLGLWPIYGYKDLEGTLTTWSFRKTAVSGSFLKA